MEDPRTIHLRIKEYLKEAIQKGELKEGDLLPSENELSARFGVNRNWPRRALRELEVEGYVLRSQGRRSAVAPVSARRNSLSIGETPIIAVALPDYLDDFDRTIVDGFMRCAAEHEINSLIYNVHLNEDQEEAFLLRAPEVGISGLAVWPQHDTPRIAEAFNALRRKKFPVVQIDRYVRGADTDYVVTDNEAMVHDLVCRLIAHGHRRIIFAFLEEDVSSVRDRLVGFKRALSEHDIPFEQRFYVSLRSIDSTTLRAAIREVMSYREAPTAFFCIHDFLASLLAAELLRLDYRIPDHVELAAVDDVRKSQILGIPMLTARQAGNDMGRIAAELLLERFYDPDRAVARQQLPFVVPEETTQR